MSKRRLSDTAALVKAKPKNPLYENESHSRSIRKIDNGYIMREDRDGPNGYTSTETFHPDKPELSSSGAKGNTDGGSMRRAVASMKPR